jgi:PIN domain nuclease of toxin-antitoxin system
VKYLLDTHVLVWALDNPDLIPARCRKLLLEGANLPLGIAAISLWEIATKATGGRLILDKPLGDWIAAAVRPPFVSILPLDERVAVESSQLPDPFHKDPADRMIVATARINGLTLLTKDQSIRDYPYVKTMWE